MIELFCCLLFWSVTTLLVDNKNRNVHKQNTKFFRRKACSHSDHFQMSGFQPQRGRCFEWGSVWSEDDRRQKKYDGTKGQVSRQGLIR
jgi:hypothetical protein